MQRFHKLVQKNSEYFKTANISLNGALPQNSLVKKANMATDSFSEWKITFWRYIVFIFQGFSVSNHSDSTCRNVLFELWYTCVGWTNNKLGRTKHSKSCSFLKGVRTFFYNLNLLDEAIYNQIRILILSTQWYRKLVFDIIGYHLLVLQ